MTENHGASINDWVNVIRRATLSPNVKLVALMLASYADPDGTHIFPGNARLAVQCSLSYTTVQRAMATLRRKGLIERTRQGARRNGKSDEYRLILAADLLERCDVPTPAAERIAMEKIIAREHSRSEQWRSTRHQRRIEPVDNPDPKVPEAPFYTSPLTCESSSIRQGDPVLHVTGDVPPSIDLYLEDQPPAEENNRRTTRTGFTRETTEDPKRLISDEDWNRREHIAAAVLGPLPEATP